MTTKKRDSKSTLYQYWSVFVTNQMYTYIVNNRDTKTGTKKPFFCTKHTSSYLEVNVKEELAIIVNLLYLNIWQPLDSLLQDIRMVQENVGFEKLFLLFNQEHV